MLLQPVREFIIVMFFLNIPSHFVHVHVKLRNTSITGKCCYTDKTIKQLSTGHYSLALLIRKPTFSILPSGRLPCRSVVACFPYKWLHGRVALCRYSHILPQVVQSAIGSTRTTKRSVGVHGCAARSRYSAVTSLIRAVQCRLKNWSGHQLYMT